jgi:hypothetical protein
MVYSSAIITGEISKINGVYDGEWDMIIEGNVIAPVVGPKEELSLFMNKKSRKDWFKNHIKNFKILIMKFNDKGKGMIIFSGGFFQSDNILFIGEKTFHILADNLCSKVEPEKSSVEEKTNQLNFTLRSKTLVLKQKKDVDVSSMASVLNLPIDIIIED